MDANFRPRPDKKSVAYYTAFYKYAAKSTVVCILANICIMIKARQC